MVYGIVKSHGGYIMGSSEPGKGTTFKIYFPAVEVASIAYGEKTEEEEQLQGGKETILLVDDEKFLLDLGEEMLQKFGYTVLTAERGERAIEIYQNRKEEIPLVILDLIMPGMGGRRCLEEILKIDPSQKVIIISGYYVDGPTKEALELGARGYIKKPYEVGDMLKSVREVLDQE
jgi:DNA-binding NtrC family response regulator